MYIVMLVTQGFGVVFPLPSCCVSSFWRENEVAVVILPRVFSENVVVAETSFFCAVGRWLNLLQQK